MTRALLALALVSRLAMGAEPVDGGTLEAIAVESATLRPLDAPTETIELGRGVCMPEPLAVTVASKVAAYEAAKSASYAAVSSPAVWILVGALVLGAGGGFALGWAVRPTAAQ